MFLLKFRELALIIKKWIYNAVKIILNIISLYHILMQCQKEVKKFIRQYSKTW